MFLAMFCLLTR